MKLKYCIIILNYIIILYSFLVKMLNMKDMGKGKKFYENRNIMILFDCKLYFIIKVLILI